MKQLTELEYRNYEVRELVSEFCARTGEPEISMLVDLLIRSVFDSPDELVDIGYPKSTAEVVARIVVERETNGIKPKPDRWLVQRCRKFLGE